MMAKGWFLQTDHASTYQFTHLHLTLKVIKIVETPRANIVHDNINT